MLNTFYCIKDKMEVVKNNICKFYSKEHLELNLRCISCNNLEWYCN